jgi:hypothetical protein
MKRTEHIVTKEEGKVIMNKWSKGHTAKLEALVDIMIEVLKIPVGAKITTFTNSGIALQGDLVIWEEPENTPEAMGETFKPEPTGEEIRIKIQFEALIANARKDWFANHEGDERLEDQEWVNSEMDKIEAMYQPKCAADIDDLKKQWLADGCWDIENTDGFQPYHDELLKWRLFIEGKVQAEETTRLVKRADELGCSVALVKYIEKLEDATKRSFENIDHQFDRVWQSITPRRL